MDEFEVVSYRPDREIRKKTITPGDYNIVPYEDSRCKILLSNVKFKNEIEEIPVDPDSRIFGKSFDGNILIGDSDNFIDKDFELVLQQMCNGEECEVKMLYRNSEGKLALDISCKVELKDTTEEQLISDWSWNRLFEAATHHKERGVCLVKEKKTIDAFRRFSKALKFLVAVEPIDPEVVPEDAIKEMKEFKVKVYNNLAHCQLQYDEYEAALELCNKAIQLEPQNIKALYRRSVAYTGLKKHEEAWTDIQVVLQLDPNDKLAQQKARQLKPIVDKIQKEYACVIKKMFDK